MIMVIKIIGKMMHQSASGIAIKSLSPWNWSCRPKGRRLCCGSIENVVVVLCLGDCLTSKILFRRLFDIKNKGIDGRRTTPNTLVVDFSHYFEQLEFLDSKGYSLQEF